VATTTPRRGLFGKLGSPVVMVALGAFELVLGISYLRQPKVRGQGTFLVVIGVLLIGAAAFIRRSEMRRGRAATARKADKVRPAATRARKVEPVARARGPKAGAGNRLAGPTRFKPAEEPKTRTERWFGGREGRDGKDDKR
jgi:hypothetical protein